MILRTPHVVSLFLFFSFLSACTPPAAEFNQSEQSTDLVEGKKNVFLIPSTNEKEPLSPLSFWISDLTQPKLLSNRSLSVECDASAPNSVVIYFPDSYSKCTEVLALNRGLNPGSSIGCLDNQTLKISGLKFPCNTRDFRALGILRDLPQSSLYTRDKKNPALLIPNPELQKTLKNALPSLQESETTQLLLLSPLNLWLAQSSRRGVMALDISPAQRKSALPAELLEELQRLREQLLAGKKAQRLSETPLELIAPPTSPKNNDGSNNKSNPAASPFFLMVTEMPTDPLLRGACEYVAQWIHSAQFLQMETLAKMKSKKIPLSCSFRLADEIPNETTLRVTELPLPLISSELKRFPIKNLDELRSVAVLQSFRVLK